jgi:hypothetical protein
MKVEVPNTQIFLPHKSPGTFSSRTASKTCKGTQSSDCQSKYLVIYTRPEIRKGCVWDIQLKFDPKMLKENKINSVYIEKPRGITGRTAPYLCLKVRSKLIKPIREIAFTKVATIVNESEAIEFNEFGTGILRVRFTARPRAVFHKHSDIMILLVSMKRGDQTLASDSSELIFRGGTGSVHSADNRRAQHVSTNPPITLSKQEKPFIENWSADTVPEIEEFDSNKFCMDFLQNKGDSLLSAFPGLSPSPTTFSDLILNSEFTNGYFSGQLGFNETYFPVESSQIQSFDKVLGDDEQVNPTSSEQIFTMVHGKRRGMCSKCLSECSFYRGAGGPCGECGCFPSQHLDLDQPQSRNKRRLESVTEHDDFTRPKKKPRLLLEETYFQRLFFDSLKFLNIQQIGHICSKAPIPIFVKDHNSVYIYINCTFGMFVMQQARAEGIINKNTFQVVSDTTEANEIVQHDKFIMTQKEGTIKTFNVSLKKQDYLVMKQWTTLSDGMKVIIGAVISSQ